jgi:hypothetical protein
LTGSLRAWVRGKGVARCLRRRLPGRRAPATSSRGRSRPKFSPNLSGLVYLGRAAPAEGTKTHSAKPSRPPTNGSRGNLLPSVLTGATRPGYIKPLPFHSEAQSELEWFGVAGARRPGRRDQSPFQRHAQPRPRPAPLCASGGHFPRSGPNPNWSARSLPGGRFPTAASPPRTQVGAMPKGKRFRLTSRPSTKFFTLPLPAAGLR